MKIPVRVKNNIEKLEKGDREVVINFLEKMAVIKPASTVQSFAATLADFCEFLVGNKLGIQDVTFKELVDFIVFLASKQVKYRGEVKKGLSGNSIRTRLKNLKSFYKDMVKTKYIDRTSFDLELLFDQDDLKQYMPVYVEKEPKRIEREVLDRILREVPAKWKCIVETLYVTGCRVGEVCNIEWRNVDFVNLEIMIVDQKTGKEYTKLITENLAHLINEYMDRYRKEPETGHEKYLFINKVGNKMSPRNVRKFLNSFTEKIAGKSINPHQFRSTFATELSEEGATDIQIMHLGGWESPKSLRRYSAMARKKKRETFERFTRPGQEAVLRKDRLKAQELLEELKEYEETGAEFLLEFTEKAKKLRESLEKSLREKK